MKTQRAIIRFCLIFIGLFLFNALYPQENYLPGYIIKANNDTIKGFIDYRNWGTNPEKIVFKENSDGGSAIFKPLEIKEFKVADEIYTSAIVSIETSSNRTENLGEDPEINLVTDTVFLQTLFKGSKSLYYYHNFNRDYLYIPNGKGFELLIYKRYLKVINEMSSINVNNKYVGQLTNYLSDNPEVVSKLGSTNYSKKDIYRIFKTYYKSRQSDILFQKKEEKISVETGILAGVSMTTLKFTGDNYGALVNAGYDPSINVSAGLSFELVLPRNHRKWSIYNELLYSAFDVKGSYTDGTIESSNYTTTTTEFGYWHLKLNNMLRFTYPVGKFHLFVNGGITNGFFVKETNYKKTFVKFYSSERTEEGVAIKDTRKHEQGLVGGIGIKSGKFSLTGQYETGNGFSDYFDLKSSTQRIYLLFGYRF